MREVRCQKTVARWLSSVCRTENSSMSLPLWVLVFSRTTNWSLACSLVQFFLRTWHPLFCSTTGSMFVLSPHAVILSMRLDLHLSCCAGYCQVACMTVCFFITVRVGSVKSTQSLLNWYFPTRLVIFPVIHATSYFFLQYLLPLHLYYQCHSRQWKNLGVSNALGRRRAERVSSLIASRCYWTDAPVIIEKKIAVFSPRPI